MTYLWRENESRQKSRRGGCPFLGELNQVQFSSPFVRESSRQLPAHFAPTGTLFSGVEGSLHSRTIYGITSLIAGTSFLLGMFKIQSWELR